MTGDTVLGPSAVRRPPRSSRYESMHPPSRAARVKRDRTGRDEENPPEETS
jgi:hypothetical protein